ncbi:MAG: hypothetical protein H6707_15720 [Deltaproteobacteria bacterium]|nr:hypothetical protein [Deltaproteobacteria bacterium]
MRVVVASVPGDGATEVAVDQPLIVHWAIIDRQMSENLPWQSASEVAETLVLEDLTTGQRVEGSTSEGLVGLADPEERVGTMRFLPESQLVAGHRYRIAGSYGEFAASFIVSDVPTARASTPPAFAGATSATVTEVKAADYSWCEGTHWPGQCPDILQTGWRYTKMIAIGYRPLLDPTWGRAGFAYRLLEVDSNGQVTTRALDHPASDGPQQITVNADKYGANPCFRVVADTLSGVTLDDGPLACVSTANVQTIPRETFPAPQKRCNEENGRWEDSTPSTSSQPKTEGAASRGCAVIATSDSPWRTTLALLLVLLALRRREQRANSRPQTQTTKSIICRRDK